MIDELDLEQLFAETADEIPVPDDGAQCLIDEMERSASEPRRVSARPTRVLAIAAAVVVVVGVGIMAAGNSTSSNKQAVSASLPDAAKSKQQQLALTPPALPTHGARSRAARDQFATSPVPGGDGSAGNPASGAANTTATPVDGAKIVKTGTLDLQAAHDQLRTVVNQVSSVAVGFGGYIANSTTSYDVTDPTAQITLRVPVGNFEAAVNRLKGLPGVKVLGDSETGKDVTAQSTDLQAQLTAAQGEESAFLVVLSHAQSIGDILAVHDRITNVQAEINQLQGQINLLNDQASFSALAVTMAEKSVTTTAAHVSTPPTGLSKAWKDARGGFSNSLDWMLARSGGALIVLLALLALVFGLRYLYPIVRRALL